MRRCLLITFGLAALAPPVLGEGLSASHAGLDGRRQRLEALTRQEDALTAKMAVDRGALAKLVGALAIFSRDPPPPLLVSPRDAEDAVRAMILARAIAPELEARAQALGSEVAVLDRLRRRAAQASGELFLAESAIEDHEGRLDAVAGDADLMAPTPVRQAASFEDAAPAARLLMAPASGPIAAAFGGRLENGLKSEGLAYRTSAGAPVRSPARGMVAYAGPLNGWGQVVILRGGGGRHMVLSGLGKVTVDVGQSVAAGSPVGFMPAGGQTPPELYFEVRLANGPLDPATLMHSQAGREH